MGGRMGWQSQQISVLQTTGSAICPQPLWKAQMMSAKLAVEVRICHVSTQEPEAGGSPQAPGQPGRHSELKALRTVAAAGAWA